MLGRRFNDDSEYHVCKVYGLQQQLPVWLVSSLMIPLDGINLIPYLSGQRAGVPHNTLYWRWDDTGCCTIGWMEVFAVRPREYLFKFGAGPR